MPDAILDIKLWGNNLGVRLPAAARAARLTVKVIWIDCEPQAGGEMRDLHPLLVLSPRDFNARTGLVIGLPMTTAEVNAGNPFALDAGVVAGVVAGVAGGLARGRKAGKARYVLCHQPKSFDWRARGAKPYPQEQLSAAVFAEACAALNQIIGIG